MKNKYTTYSITPPKYITDTMSLVLRLERRKLPKRIKEIFEQAEKLTIVLAKQDKPVPTPDRVGSGSSRT